jgi:hypothetical protein
MGWLGVEGRRRRWWMYCKERAAEGEQLSVYFKSK